jgi:hypothetical protein
MSAEVYCYCNSHRHLPDEHPVAGCLVTGCCEYKSREDVSRELEEHTALLRAEKAVLDAALAWEEKRTEDWAGNAAVRARLVLLDAIRAYRVAKEGA